MLQLCNSSTTFKLATALFMKKWKMNSKQKNQSILGFLNYFDYEWLTLNDGWYEGLQLNTPSTNNALEATNRTIKDDGTFRERHVLSRFLAISSNIIYNWSTERDSLSVNAKLFAIEPTISLELWTSSYQWAQSRKEHIVGIAIRLKCCKPPPAAKTVPIGQKRKRGRPAKAKAALLIQ
ncbi:unnamed protein product [Rotaria sordida]|uniref:Uncharacterized protein n=1 Tax=Rotaria sordida TaxID=392033 RepID=A0A815PHF8_9BILA|nr:unnamed protein product [Rotaria sordida]CAF1449522.1 unnamed protein product [Rotaria sordida]